MGLAQNGWYKIKSDGMSCGNSSIGEDGEVGVCDRHCGGGAVVVAGKRRR